MNHDDDYQVRPRVRASVPDQPAAVVPVAKVGAEMEREVRMRTHYDPLRDEDHYQWTYRGHKYTATYERGFGGDQRKREWLAKTRIDALVELTRLAQEHERQWTEAGNASTK